MNSAPIGHIVICGAGLAGHMAAAALSRYLPASVRITLLDCRDAAQGDLFYGNVTSPSAYDFNLWAGVSEPQLIMQSDAAFSYGTRYLDWGRDGRSWVQCFHLPFQVLGGVQFHHYLTQQGIGDLEPFLVSAVAAARGAFAHPPQEANQPLSRAEYGYQIDPLSYAGLFQAATDKARVQTIAAAIGEIETSGKGIDAIRLADGQSLSADLFVDCTGPESLLLSRAGGSFSGARRVRAAFGSEKAARLGPPCRTVRAGDYGWQAQTPLKGRSVRMTLYDPSSEGAALAAHGAAPAQTVEMTLGRHEQAWCGNVVALGQAAGVVEPLSPAPIMLLQRDIERLLSLIPFSADEMTVERFEFNRHYNDDYRHAGLFNRALTEKDDLPRTPYWDAARGEPTDEKLLRKIEQFESRGLLVTYDLEPFNKEDWAILHFGMGRTPARYERFADQAPQDKVGPYLANLRQGIAKMVQTMPDHDRYVRGMIQYLRQNPASQENKG